jgi:hypothetical protein
MQASAAAQSVPSSLPLLRQLSRRPDRGRRPCTDRREHRGARRCRNGGSHARDARVRVTFLSRAQPADASSWQHPWQQPDCPIRPYRPRAGTVRTIWTDLRLTDKVERLVRDHRVEVRVLFGA